jgi:chorismate--pyruvate lyase
MSLATALEMTIPSGNDNLWHRRPTGADARLRGWLLDRGSLTRRIQSHCDQFGLEVLSQRRAVIGADERAIMGVHPDEKCLVREVSLNCSRRPVVFAHSVIENRALRGEWRALATLGGRPLTVPLFADPRVERYPLRFCLLNRRHVLHRRACNLLESPPRCLWARRSLFVLRGSRLLVTEVFLPAILTLKP